MDPPVARGLLHPDRRVPGGAVFEHARRQRGFRGRCTAAGWASKVRGLEREDRLVCQEAAQGASSHWPGHVGATFELRRSSVSANLHLLRGLDQFEVRQTDDRLLQSATQDPDHRLWRRESRSGCYQGMDGGDFGLVRYAQHREVNLRFLANYEPVVFIVSRTCYIAL